METPIGGNSDQNFGCLITQHFVIGFFFLVSLLLESWVETSDVISDPLDPLDTKEIEVFFSVLKKSFLSFVLSKFFPRIKESWVYILSLNMPSNSAIIANINPNVTRNPFIIMEFWNCLEGTFDMYENEYNRVSDSDKEFKVLRSENRSTII